MKLLHIGSILFALLCSGQVDAEQVTLTRSRIVGTVVEMDAEGMKIEVGCSSDSTKYIATNELLMIDFSSNECELKKASSSRVFGSGLSSKQRSCIGGYLVKFTGKSGALQLTTAKLFIEKSTATFHPDEKTTITGSRHEVKSIHILDCETFNLLHNSQSARWPLSYVTVDTRSLNNDAR